MNNRVTSEEVANQFAKAIQLLLEWARQEMLAPSQPKALKPMPDRTHENDQIPIDARRLLKAKEVADILQVSRSMAYRMMQRGEISTVRVGSAVRVRGSDLEEFIKRGKDTL
jgi:excisionase family DNA binding protein